MAIIGLMKFRYAFRIGRVRRGNKNRQRNEITVVHILAHQLGRTWYSFVQDNTNEYDPIVAVLSLDLHSLFSLSIFFDHFYQWVVNLDIIAFFTNEYDPIVSVIISQFRHHSMCLTRISWALVLKLLYIRRAKNFFLEMHNKGLYWHSSTLMWYFHMNEKGLMRGDRRKKLGRKEETWYTISRFLGYQKSTHHIEYPRNQLITWSLILKFMLIDEISHFTPPSHLTLWKQQIHLYSMGWLDIVTGLELYYYCPFYSLVSSDNHC